MMPPPPVVPRLRHASEREHAALPPARPDRPRRPARGVLRGAAPLRLPRRRRSTSTPSGTRTSSSGSRSARCPTARSPEPNPLWRPESYDRYLDWVLEEGTTPNGVFGAKLMWGYLGDFADPAARDRGQRAAADPARCSSAASRTCATSRSRAATRSARRSRCGRPCRPRRGARRGRRRGARVEPVFSFRADQLLVRQLTAHDASWDAYFLGLGAEPLKVTYEELAEAPEPVVGRVLEHLRHPGAGRAAARRARRSPCRPTSARRSGSGASRSTSTRWSSRRRASRPSAALADDLGRGLVVAQAEEARVAQAAVARPLAEADLGDELAARPRSTCALADLVGERRVVAARAARGAPRGRAASPRVKPVPTLPA